MTSIFFFLYKLYSSKVKALSLSRSEKKDETDTPIVVPSTYETWTTDETQT